MYAAVQAFGDYHVAKELNTSKVCMATKSCPDNFGEMMPKDLADVKQSLGKWKVSPPSGYEHVFDASIGGGKQLTAKQIDALVAKLGSTKLCISTYDL
jgi:hypothetical protein